MNQVAIINREKYVKTGEQGKPGTVNHVVRAKSLSRRTMLRSLVIPFLVWNEAAPQAPSSDCDDGSSAPR